MGLVGAIAGGLVKLVSNAQVGKQAIAAGYVGGTSATVTSSGGNLKLSSAPVAPAGDLGTGTPWYKAAWVKPVAIGAGVIAALYVLGKILRIIK